MVLPGILHPERCDDKSAVVARFGCLAADLASLKEQFLAVGHALEAELWLLDNRCSTRLNSASTVDVNRDAQLPTVFHPCCRQFGMTESNKLLFAEGWLETARAVPRGDRHRVWSPCRFLYCVARSRRGGSAARKGLAPSPATWLATRHLSCFPRALD